MSGVFEGIEEPEAGLGKEEKRPVTRKRSAKPQLAGIGMVVPKSAVAAKPRKRRKTSVKMPKAAKGSLALLPDRRDSDLYNLLRAYSKNKALQPLLLQEGVVIDASRLRSMSDGQMQSLLLEAEEALDAAMSSSVLDSSAKALLGFLEGVVHARTSFKPQGLTKCLFDDESWVALYERVKLRAGLGVKPSDPALELLVKTLQAGQAVHMQNVMKNHGVDLNAPPANAASG